MKKADLILCADIHLREDTPVCRTDDFQASQWKKLRFLKKLQKKHNCQVLHAGDLFHHWKPSPYLLAKTMKNLPKQFCTVYGQHDLPQHNFELRNKSGIYALEAAGSLEVLEGCHWGDSPEISDHNKILVWHKFVWDGKKIPWPGCNEMTALDILEKYSQYDLIVTGDHHKPFVKKLDGRILVNPGCFTRQAADYTNHQPRVYLYYADADENKVEPVYLPCAGPEVISTEHLEEVKERNRSLEAFIQRLSDDWEIGLSFEDNMIRFLKNNPVRKEISSIIYKALEHEK